MNQTRRATLAGLLVALNLAAGFALAGIPNVELLTLLLFLSGFVLGPRTGAVVGAGSWGLFSAFNPMGAAVPPVLAAQAVWGGIIGLSGGVLGPLLLRPAHRGLSLVACGVTGAVLTLAYQIVVNTVMFWVFTDERALGAMWVYVAGGIAFTLTHLIWNTAVFLVALRPLMGVLDRYRLELES
jgi:hypothetical protein